MDHRPLQNTDDDAAAPVTEYREPSAAIFSMYITRVQKFEDEKKVENWDKGAQSILVFTGLFSSTVATFIALSYPSLQQDPNLNGLNTQLLLAQILQQLSNTTTGNPIISTGSSIQGPVKSHPPTSVVFINAVWFISLVLSLTCALLATLLQQWARNYLQIVQRKYAPLHHARIHEYFSRGARKFGISGFVNVIPVLLLLSVSLFFAGLAVFAFRGNHIVAYCTFAIVGLCAFLYIILSLLPLIYDDCPYQTPLTPIFRFFVQMILISFFSPPYHLVQQLRKYWARVDEDLVKSLDQKRTKAESFSKDIVSKLEDSAEPLSIGMYKDLLARTLGWLNEGHELEEFVTGIPSLYDPAAFPTHDDDDVQRNIRLVLTDLPRLTGSPVSLPWDIIQLAQRAFTSGLPKSVQKRRTRACLKALYYIPGAIRDILAPYAAKEQYSQEILPLLSTLESLEIIDELWDTPNDDVALSVRCTAAVIAAFMMPPPSGRLYNSVTPGDGFIWRDITGEQFLTKRLRVGDDAVAPHYHPRSDDARLRNIVRFLTDIEGSLPYVDTQWWKSDSLPIRRERERLSETRHTDDYRNGNGTFDRDDNRKSTVFLPAAQQDLITLTLEILARGPVVKARESQCDAFNKAYKQLEQVMSIQADEQADERTQEQTPEQVLVGDYNRLKNRALFVEMTEMVQGALQPVWQSLATIT